MSMFRRFWNRFVAWFRPEANHAPAPPPVSKPAAPEPEPLPPQLTPNRKARRTISALERARRKHDKFVEPQGTPPTPRAHEICERDEPRQATVPTVAPVNSAELLLADKHHTGEDLVLFKESELYGEFNFRDTILDQLESYFVYLARMRRHDNEAYQFYRQVGAHILPYSAVHIDHPRRLRERWQEAMSEPKQREALVVPPFFRANLPGFGCFVYGANKTIEEYESGESNRKGKLWIPKFMYFTKYQIPPPEMQLCGGEGAYYGMTIYWDRPQDKKFKAGRPQLYGVFVRPDGSVKVLRQLETKVTQVLKKKHKRNGRYFFNLPQRAWRIPHEYEEWAEYNHEDVQIFLGNIFARCAEALEWSQFSMVRVAVSKGDMTAVFGVNISTMGYFFKDRDYQLTESGSRKPVFHMVRGHERRTRDGRTYQMPWHFRGEREFTWAGYDVRITVPGKDHFVESEMNVGVIDDFWIDPEERSSKYTDAKEFGRTLAEVMKPHH